MKKVDRIWGLEVFRFILVWMTFFFHAWGNGISFKQMNFFVANGAVAMEGFFCYLVLLHILAQEI